MLATMASGVVHAGQGQDQLPVAPAAVAANNGQQQGFFDRWGTTFIREGNVTVDGGKRYDKVKDRIEGYILSAHNLEGIDSKQRPAVAQELVANLVESRAEIDGIMGEFQQSDMFRCLSYCCCAQLMLRLHNNFLTELDADIAMVRAEQQKAERQLAAMQSQQANVVEFDKKNR